VGILAVVVVAGATVALMRRKPRTPAASPPALPPRDPDRPV